MPPDGFPRRRHHAFLVRRTGHRVLPRHRPDRRGDDLRRTLGAGHRMGRQQGPHPRRFGHRHHLVGGHGRRRALHEPAAGLHVGRSLRIPVRQHRHRDTRRRRGADRSDAVHHRRSAAMAAAGDVRGLRPRFRPQPGHSDPRDLLRDGGADRRDDRPLDPHHGNRPADFAAHDARCHRQFALALVPDHRALRAAGRRGGQAPASSSS